jgi:hypothetical protein
MTDRKMPRTGWRPRHCAGRPAWSGASPDVTPSSGQSSRQPRPCPDRLEPRARASAGAEESLRQRTPPAGGCLPLSHDVDALGRAPDGSHSEESIAVVGLARETAVGLGRQFEQDAIFELHPGSQVVVGCDGSWTLTRALSS